MLSSKGETAVACGLGGGGGGGVCPCTVARGLLAVVFVVRTGARVVVLPTMGEAVVDSGVGTMALE